MKMNSLLVHQSAEKDEMNAKSLSTILHLKSLTEKLEQEKELLEQQTKSAGQVNVAARLASNARDRVAEEVKSLRTSLESQVKDLEQQLEHAKESQTQALANLTMKEAELKTLLASASTAQGRCDELVAESQKLLEEKKALLESLAVAQREASEATSLVNRMRSAKGGSSLFTVEQLETQVSVLKSRLACPVCNHRDKGCIISRCKHMFCKVCIDENIKNRNRKCPSCGQRFDTKDVEDIWL
jgi:E3 ubiquitin-protein ligase BRE1